MKQEIIKKGGKIKIKHEIEGLDQKDNELTKIKIKNKKDILLERDTLVLSTLPITLTSRFLGYKSDLKFRGIRSIYISINKKRVLPKQVNWLSTLQKIFCLIGFQSQKQ